MSAAERAKPVSAAEASRLFSDLCDAPAVIVAVSGGPDSTALLLIAARWRARRKRGPRLLAVTVDHGLRPQSRREAAAVKRLAQQLGVAHRTLRWSGPKPATGIQQAARHARYRLLAKAARQAGARHILTAHTLDDQAETVLIRLARGSGIGGLAAMARVAPLPDGEDDPASALRLVRPLLDIDKARLIATLDRAGIVAADDPSNHDPRFTRARIRALMPALAREGLDAPRLAALAGRLRRADRAIEAQVDAAAAAIGSPAAHGVVVFDAARFAALPQEVALRLIGRAVARLGTEGPVQLAKLESLLAALLQAIADRRRFRRTLAGAMVTLVRGTIAVEPAPPRRGAAPRGS